MAPYKPRKRARARELRREHGKPIKRIASALGVSPSSVLNWTSDIELTPEQQHRNLYGPRGPQNPEHIAARVAAWKETARNKRRAYQREGALLAREGDPLHMAGCMLYWAEGAKARNVAKLANSDLNLVRFFCDFLRDVLAVPPSRISMSLNVYLNNGIDLDDIEAHWLKGLDLARSSLRGHSLNAYPTSSSGRKKNKLPYGVCTIRVHDTHLVQHIYGAIQEYGGFEEPRWLDC
jgi:transposase-like protein